MSTKFLRRANEFQLVDSAALNVHDVLPPGNYIIKQDPQTGALYLEKVDDFQNPPKFYGDTVEKAGRILHTFKTRASGTGVLLSGEKGSGKTLLARTISMMAAKEGIPTIIINAPWAGDAFFSFINSITQPAILMFDEFEKVYSGKEAAAHKTTAFGGGDNSSFYGDNPAQNAILTLLDGVFQNKKLSLLTCNDKFGINRNMLNRPGRVFYALEFHGLGEDFVREYATDNLNDTLRVEQVVRVSNMFSDFNFDMLKALIEEMNRYEESAADALEMLNISPERDYSNWKVEVMPHGKRVDEDHPHLYPEQVESPLSKKDGIKVRVYCLIEAEKKNTNVVTPDHDADYVEEEEEGKNKRTKRTSYEYWMKFRPDDMVSISSERIVFRNKLGDILNLERIKYTSSNWREYAADKMM